MHILNCNKIRGDLTRKLYCKFSIDALNTTADIYSLVDTGADVPILSINYLKQIYPKLWKPLFKLIKPTDVRILSFTNDEIKVLGTITFNVRFHNEVNMKKLTFFVTSGQGMFLCPAIIGIKTLCECNIDMTFYKSDGKCTPSLSITTDRHTHVLQSYYLSDAEVNTCIAKSVSLQAGQIKAIQFYVNEISPIKLGQHAIVSPLFHNNNIPNGIKVTTTRSQVKRCPDTAKLYAVGIVLNDQSNNCYNVSLECQIENSDDYDILQLTSENLGVIQKHSTLFDVDLEPSNHYTYGGYFQLKEDNIAPNESCNVDYTKTTEPTHINVVGRITYPEHTDIGCNKLSNNNDTENPQIALTDERFHVESDKPLDSKLMEEFQDENHTINLGIKDLKDEEINQEMNDVKGYYIPNNERTVEDVLEIEKLPKDIQPYITDIFLHSYPDVVALHSMHKGNLSSTLGRYELKLKPGAKLPNHKSTYYLAPAESEHLKQILSHMIAENTIMRAPTTGDNLHNFACSSYIIPRKDLNACGRVIVNYAPLNRCLNIEPQIIPKPDSLIHSLRDKTYFTAVDISQAYYSLEITPESRPLTAFSSPWGNYYFKVMPTGAAPSPAILHRYVDKMLNYEIVRDEKGNIVWEEENIAKLEHNPLKDVYGYFDDILIATKFEISHDFSRKLHFDKVKEVVRRISAHTGKLNVRKSLFFKNKLKFLGFLIMGNFICPDPKRIQKLLDLEQPETHKGWRSILGIANSLRTVMGHSVLRNVTTLSPLTSIKNCPRNLSLEQVNAFKDLKCQLKQGPIFANMILVGSPMILFVDASSSNDGSFAAVLCQVISPKHRKETVPSWLFLEDPCHVIILNKKLPCIPADTKQDDESIKNYTQRININYPPASDYLEEEYFGLTEKEFPYSLTFTLASLLALHNCSMTCQEIGTKLASEIQKGTMKMIKLQLKQFFLNNSSEELKMYSNDLKQGRFRVDRNLYIIDALAIILQRPITVVSSITDHQNDNIITFNGDKQRPPFYILLYETKHGLVTRGAYLDKEECYDIGQHKGALEIVAYHSKTLPDSVKSSHILELECYAIKSALKSLQKYIGAGELLLLSDSKPLFYMFNATVKDNKEKIKRWSLEITSLFPQLTLGFVASEKNWSDFLSKQFHTKKMAPRILKLPNFVDSSLKHLVDQKTFTITEWEMFVNENNHLLEVIDNKTDHISNEQNNVAEITKVNVLTRKQRKMAKQSSSTTQTNLVNITSPISLLEKLLLPENLMEKQKLEYAELYKKTLMNPKLMFVEKDCEFVIKHGILYRNSNNKTQIMLPPSLLAHLVAFGHLTCGHGGYEKLRLNLQNYYCKGLSTAIANFCKACLPCALVNKPTSSPTIATYFTPDQPFESVHLDFMESLPPVDSYRHLLVCTELLTGAILLFPTKTKTSKEFLNVFLYSIFQHYKCSTLLTDNSTAFICKETIATLAALKIRVVHTSSLSPLSKGNVEVKVKLGKTVLKKMLVSCPDFNWLLLPPIISQMYNSTKLPRHKHSPLELIYGTNSRLSSGIWPLLDSPVKLHPLVKKFQEDIDHKSQTIKTKFKQIQVHIDNAKDKRNISINKNKHNSQFQEGDVIFVKNSTYVPGTTQPLKTAYQISPFKIVELRKTTALVIRMIDNFMTVLHYDRIKKYTPHDPMFEELNEDIKNMLLKTINKDELNEKDMLTLIKAENFDMPLHEIYKRNDSTDDIEHKVDRSDTISPTENEDVEKELHDNLIHDNDVEKDLHDNLIHDNELGVQDKEKKSEIVDEISIEEKIDVIPNIQKKQLENETNIHDEIFSGNIQSDTHSQRNQKESKDNNQTNILPTGTDNIDELYNDELYPINNQSPLHVMDELYSE